MYSLIVTAKPNDVDPQAWLADVLTRINDQPVSHLHEFLPWNSKNTRHANHTEIACSGPWSLPDAYVRDALLALN